MKGAKPGITQNVIPMKGDIRKHVPDPPDDMSGRAAEVWQELAPLLVAKDRFDPLFVYQFRSYCQNVANFIDATLSVEVEGLYFEAGGGRNGRQQKKSAAFTVQQEAMNQMRRDSALFGLSPVDSMRIAAGSQGDLFDDIMSKLDGGH
jgi:P27 family predicted phage terminase small subunit